MQNLRPIALTMLSFGLLIGCGPSDDVVDRDPDDLEGLIGDLDDEEQRNAPFDIETRFTASKFIVDIYGGRGDTFFCGLAETGLPANEGWYGESCFESEYCHPCGTVGAELTTGSAKENVNEGFSTYFSGPEGVTYYVENLDTQECYVWGDRPTYYTQTEGLDCVFWNGDEPE